MVRLALIGLLCLTTSTVLGAENRRVLEYAAHPDTNNNFAEARFTCVIPDRQPRAILFLAGGTDSDARSWVHNSEWQALAERERLVLIGAFLRGAGESYEVAAGGSGQALLDAIDNFAKASGQPNLAYLPLVLYGHSAGAQFAFHFACWNPERVHAIVCMKSGPLPEELVKFAPRFSGLFVVGEHDLAVRNRHIARAFAAGRTLGAPWCLALQPNSGHGAEGTRDLVHSFIASVLLQNSASPRYAQISEPGRQGAAATAKNAPSYSCLPNGTFAGVWRTFAKNVSLSALTNLPEDKPGPKLLCHPMVSVPEQVTPQGRLKFEYVLSLPEADSEIQKVKVMPTVAALTASATRQSNREWKIIGHFNPERLPLGPFRGHIRIEAQTSKGKQISSELPIFTRLSGPFAASPPSLYYGIIPQGKDLVLHVVVRADGLKKINSCTATSSDPHFLAITLETTLEQNEIRATCKLRAGSRIGSRHGRIDFNIKADEQYVVTVPYYGFIQK